MSRNERILIFGAVVVSLALNIIALSSIHRRSYTLLSLIDQQSKVIEALLLATGSLAKMDSNLIQRLQEHRELIRELADRGSR